MTSSATKEGGALSLEERRAIHTAVQAIASRCDGAQELDGVGFNGTHAPFGNQVAQLPLEVLSDEVVGACHEMLRTYRGQLAEEGIDFDRLPVPPAAGRASLQSLRTVVIGGHHATVRFGYDQDLIAGVRTLPGARWNPQNKSWFVPVTPVLEDWAKNNGFKVARLNGSTPAPVDRPKGRVTTSGPSIVIRFTDFHPELVDKVKRIPGRQWDPARTAWVIPQEMVRAVRRLVADHKHELLADERFLNLQDMPPVSVRIDGQRLILKGPQEYRLTEKLKSLGGRWRGDWRAWVLPLDQAGALLKALDKLGFEHNLDVEAVHRHLDRLRHNLEMSSATDAELPEIPGLAMDLFPFQRAGVAYALEHRRIFNASEVGLGKTLQALASLEAGDAWPAVIVCPAAVKLNWLREARRALPKRHGLVLSGTKARPFGLLRPDYVVVNYDVVGAWNDVLVKELQPKGLVIDESHLCKEPTTQRTQHVQELGAAVPRDGGEMVLALSATPVLNQRREYAAQLEALGRLQEFGGAKAVEYDPDVAEHLKSAGAMFRVLKKDVLQDLPPVIWSYVPVEPDPKVMERYEKAERDLLHYLAEQAAEVARETGADPRAAAFKARMRARSAEHLVRIGVLKQLAAKAKLPAAKQWVQGEIGAGEKLLLFAHHMAILDSIQATFGCQAIRGGQKAEERMAVVDRFQEGKDPLLALGLTAGGVGLTLTAAELVVFLEQGWTPAIHDQAVGRVWGRLNDCHGARAAVLFVEGTIDEFIMQLLAQKRIEVDHATDGIDPDDLSDTGGQSIAGELITDLTDLALRGGTVKQMLDAKRE